MGGQKRKRKNPSISPSPSKMQKVNVSTSVLVICEPDEDEVELARALELIRQQEESERLAIRLQRGMDHETRAESSRGVSSNQVATGSSFSVESDEAFARKLALGWGEIDAQAAPGRTPIPSSSNYSCPTRSEQKESATTTVTVPKVDQELDPEEDLNQYRDLFIQTRNCTKCGVHVQSPRGMVVFSTTVPPPSLSMLLHAVCDMCGKSHCRGCFRPRACEKVCKGKTCNIDKCCAEVRAIALFEALGGLDRQYLIERLGPSKVRPKPSPTKSKNVNTVGPAGTGYSITSSMSSREKKQDKTNKSDDGRWDVILTRAISTIMNLLPCPDSENVQTYDLIPHLSIRSLISISYLPELISDLLVNDSVTDWTARSELYNSMLNLLRCMVGSELTVGTLVEERWEKKKSQGLEPWMWREGAVEWEKTGDKTDSILCAPPLYERFKKLTKHCETFMAGAQHLFEDDGDDGTAVELTVTATSLCGDMISAQQDIQRILSVLMQGRTSRKYPSPAPEIPGAKGKGKDPNIEFENHYAAECEKLAFEHVPLHSEVDGSSGGLDCLGFHYNKKVKATENSTRQPKARLHLIKEISALSTSLPPGVWVRVDDVRTDVIKFMIAGPEGTPYANGLFEFDCFMPVEYPNTPPLVNLQTTGGGLVRFNPNLYNCGKVCLSLLGTWAGGENEQWSASRSTLLQVIISIQSMILVDAPYFNEPGYGHVNLTNPKSMAYNHDIRLQTIHWAMNEWMQEKHKKGIWADVIATHFTIRQHKIKENFKKWAAEDPKVSQYASVFDSRCQNLVTWRTGD